MSNNAPYNTLSPEEKNSGYLPDIRKVCLIRSLKDFRGKDGIKQILNDYKKRQEKDYFTYERAISLGSIGKKKKYDKENNLLPYSYVGPADIFTPIKKTKTLNNNTINISKVTRNSSTSSVKKTKHVFNNSNENFQFVDNKSLRYYYEDIKKRINDQKNKKLEQKSLLIKLPRAIRKSLNDQENIFLKQAKTKRSSDKLEDYLKVKAHKESKNDLLMNKSNDFQNTMQEKIIVNKNITEDVKYRDNFWTVTLRNPIINGQYEKVGYLNVGNKYEPMFTLFNLNNNIEYVKNPKGKNKSISYKDLDENSHFPKTKQDLLHLNNIRSLKINGKNLLDLEINRENKIKGKKILYNKRNIEFMYDKEVSSNTPNKTAFIESYNFNDLSNNRVFADNFSMRDYYKGLNLTSKYSNSVCKTCYN